MGVAYSCRVGWCMWFGRGICLTPPSTHPFIHIHTPPHTRTSSSPCPRKLEDVHRALITRGGQARGGVVEGQAVQRAGGAAAAEGVQPLAGRDAFF